MVSALISLFHIFRVDADGNLIWCERADSLEVAVHRMEVLKANTSATFVLISFEIGGGRIFGTLPDPVSARSKSSAA